LPGLGDEVGRAALHGFDCSVQTTVGGNHYDNDLWVYLQNFLKPDLPFSAARFTRAEIHIEQHNIEVVIGEQSRYFLRVTASCDTRELAPEQQATRRQDVLVIIDDKDVAGFADFCIHRVFEIVHSLSASVQF